MGFSGEPSLAAQVKALHLGTAKARHIALHFVPELVLQISKMPITLGEFSKKSRIERQLRSRVERIKSILFINWLAQDQSPATFAGFKKIIKAPGADDIAEDAVDGSALMNLHLRLGNGAVVGKIDSAAAEEMQDVDATLEPLAAHRDEA